MKGLEFVKNLNETLAVTIPDDVLAKLGEIELPDELNTKFKEVFISRERAKSDAGIIEHVVKDERKKIFDIFDKKIETLLPHLLKEDVDEIGKKFQTFEKFDLAVKGVENMQKNSKGKVSEDVQKIQDDFLAKMKAKEDSHKKELLDQQNKFQETQFEFVVKDKLKSYKLAEQFTSITDNLSQLAIIDLKSKPYKYKLESGGVAIYKEENGIDVFAFEEGKESKVTLEKLLDKFVDPFIAKSQGGSGTTPPNGHKPPTPGTLPKIPNGEMSLADRRRAAEAARA
jgi:hypothetical protein